MLQCINSTLVETADLPLPATTEYQLHAAAIGGMQLLAIQSVHFQTEIGIAAP